jgi:hypothetical protein
LAKLRLITSVIPSNTQRLGKMDTKTTGSENAAFITAMMHGVKLSLAPLIICRTF